MGGHDPFQIQSLIMKFEMNHTLPLALSKIIAKLLWEVFPDAPLPCLDSIELHATTYPQRTDVLGSALNSQ